MNKIVKTALFVCIPAILIITFFVLARNAGVQLLTPHGYIAQQQSTLLIGVLILAACIGIPLIGIMLFIVFRFRDTNNDANYAPNWKGSNLLIAIWWIAPAVVVLFWGIIAWQSVHALDPYKPIDPNVRPILIQVVSLQWKWLFIYPDQKIAAVNALEFPVNTPLSFQLTSDAPMNSFWIPSLGSQIYSMTGMETQLHLIANTTGNFPGGSAEMSGSGYAGMQFVAKSVTLSQYNAWLKKIYASSKQLDQTTYDKLAKPSSYVPPTYYRYTDSNLFSEIMMKYMLPSK
jgi:cytochrome o ubiquinol oxidase subunit 2